MNFNKFINSDYLKNNPLCGIGTYKDELYLATGACTRQIKKLVLTGNEAWTLETGTTYQCSVDMPLVGYVDELSTHYQMAISYAELISTNSTFALSKRPALFINDNRFSTVSDFKAYLAAQYAAGTPVCVWYVLATPTTETITVPSGLSGIEEGYLNQSGTPTPTNPIYPTANTVEKWFDINHYIHNTSTDTITTLPAVLYPTGATATVGLKGQTLQSSIPSPTSPVMPEDTGERTGNLLNLNRTYSNSFTTDTTKWMNGAATMNNAGTVYAESEIIGDVIKVTSKSPGYGASFLIEASPNTTYTVSFETDKEASGSWGGISDRDINGIVIRSSTISGKSITFTTHDNCAFLNVCFRFPPADGTVTFSKIMLNLGSTALPYEPFGVKIPISSTNTTTPIYLGEVQSTRQIQKVVLTGEETWINNSNNACCVMYLQDIGLFTTINPLVRCSHFPTATSQSELYNRIVDYGITFGGSSADRICIRNKDTEPVTDFKTYLQQQYANGTPVTVWYVLATPTTGIVNEPLHKIGDYADEVSNVSIPVTAGGDTLSVGTTVQPSEVTVNYKGWHPVANIHEYDNGAWT